MIRRLLFIVISFFLFFTAAAQKTHTVKPGETIESIARLYQLTTDELKKHNESAEMIFPGLLLTIPTKIVKPKSEDKKNENTKGTDKVIMRDGSYILCKVVGIKKNLLTIKQEESEGNISIPVKYVIEINYENGSKKKFNRR